MVGIEKKAAKQTSCGGKSLLCRGKRMESIRRHQLWQKHLDKNAFAKRVASYAKGQLPK